MTKKKINNDDIKQPECSGNRGCANCGLSSYLHPRVAVLGDIVKMYISYTDQQWAIVSELSRLGRSTLQILEIMQEAKAREIAVHAIKGGWSLNGSMESKIVLHMLAMVSEIERDLISARTKEALKARKADGVVLGRPKGPGKSKLDPCRADIIEDLRRGIPKTRIARDYKTSPENLWNWIKKNGINAEDKTTKVSI